MFRSADIRDYRDSAMSHAFAHGSSHNSSDHIFQKYVDCARNRALPRNAFIGNFGRIVLTSIDVYPRIPFREEFDTTPTPRCSIDEQNAIG